MKPQTDRRAFSRLKDKCEVTAIVTSAPHEPVLEGKTLKCRTKDLSIGGIQVFTRRNVPVGSILSISLVSLRPEGKFELTGRVVWTQAMSEAHRFVLGVHLVQLEKTTTVAWSRWLALRSRMR